MFGYHNKWEIINLALVLFVLGGFGYFTSPLLISVPVLYLYLSRRLWMQKGLENVDNDFFAFVLLSFNFLYLGFFSSILIF
tara:strand:- start:588 stop:830 length:243 start_codon:yes stop_codon:yes gene_type:complete